MGITDFAAAIGTGIAANIATEKVKPKAEDVVNSALGQEPGKTQNDYLNDIHLLLVDLVSFFKHNPPDRADLYNYVRIYKQGLGPPYKPSHIGNRQHFEIFSGAAILLNCSGSGLGSFNITTKQADWTILDLPDNSEYVLDASVTAPNGYLVFWQRETNANVV